MCFSIFVYMACIWNLNETVKFSGDLLQHFLAVIFNKLGKGELTNDDFELNIILQVTKFDLALSTKTAVYRVHTNKVDSKFEWLSTGIN